MPQRHSSSGMWGRQAKNPGGFFNPQKKCPPVDDCDVKNFVVAGKRITARGKKEIAAVARAQKEARKKEAEQKKREAAARKQEAEDRKRQRSWPNAGKYNPKKK